MGTLLRFEPADGKLLMTVRNPDIGGHDSVVLDADWLLPLAAWFAGEAQPGIVGHDEYGAPYGRWLAIASDEAAVAYGTHTWARLDCLRPYGRARVAIGPRGRAGGFAAMLSPSARAAVATWLRRVAAEYRSESAPDRSVR